MEKFLTANAELKYYYLLIGHNKKNFIHPELIIPRQDAQKKKDEVWDKTYAKTYAMDDIQVHEETVKMWASNGDKLKTLELAEKNAINSLKGFMNATDWRTLVSFHNKQCDMQNKYAYGNHVHLVISTTIQQLSKQPLYRALQRRMDGMKGICTLQSIRGDTQSFMHYLASDEEKCFLGTNDANLLQLYTDSMDSSNIMKKFQLDDETDPSGLTLRKQIAWTYTSLPTDKTSSDEEDDDEQRILPLDGASTSASKSIKIPNNLKNCKAADTVTFLIDLLRKHPKARDATSLLACFAPHTEMWKSLCNIGGSHSYGKHFQLALDTVKNENNMKTPAQTVQELPDKIDTYMTPQESQAVFNAWCSEQNISPMRYTALMKALLEEKVQKRVGLYLQGAPNSGKTVMTHSMWNCMNDMVGRLTKDNFMLQDCGSKKLVIGEEIALTTGNVETFKDLMSGTTVQCPRKCTTPTTCKPSIVFMNSNAHFNANLDKEKTVAIRMRIFHFQDLRKSQIMSRIRGNMHPKLFYHNTPELTDDMLQALITDQTDYWDMDPIGDKQVFTGDWSELHPPSPQQYEEVTENEEDIDRDLANCEIPEEDSQMPDTQEQEAADEDYIPPSQVVTPKNTVRRALLMSVPPGAPKKKPRYMESSCQMSDGTVLSAASHRMTSPIVISSSSSNEATPKVARSNSNKVSPDSSPSTIFRFNSQSTVNNDAIPPSSSTSNSSTSSRGSAQRREDARELWQHEQPQEDAWDRLNEHHDQVMNDINLRWSSASSADSAISSVNFALEPVTSVVKNPFTNLVNVTATCNQFLDNLIFMSLTELRKHGIPYTYRVELDTERPDRHFRLDTDTEYQGVYFRPQDIVFTPGAADGIDPLTEDWSGGYYTALTETDLRDQEDRYTTVTYFNSQGCVANRFRFKELSWTNGSPIKTLAIYLTSEHQHEHIFGHTLHARPVKPDKYDIDEEVTVYKIVTMTQHALQQILMSTMFGPYKSMPTLGLYIDHMKEKMAQLRFDGQLDITPDQKYTYDSFMKCSRYM